MLSFGEKIAKIGPADLEIICLREIIKDEEKRKKRRVKYIALSAGLPSGLNNNNIVTCKECKNRSYKFEQQCSRSSTDVLNNRAADKKT